MVKPLNGKTYRSCMYEIYFGTAVKKDLKKLPKNVKEKINEIFILLSKNPLIGENLKGEFFDYYSFHFKEDVIQYRIIYSIKDLELVVLIILVGTRENIYKQLKRRI